MKSCVKLTWMLPIALLAIASGSRADSAPTSVVVADTEANPAHSAIATDIEMLGRVFDVSDPSSPREVSSYKVPAGVTRIQVDESRICEAGLMVLDKKLNRIEMRSNHISFSIKEKEIWATREVKTKARKNPRKRLNILRKKNGH